MTRVVRFLFFAVFALAVCGSPCLAKELEKSGIELVRGNGGSMTFSVEIADTLEKRQKGMMFRAHLPWQEGMLFDFERDMVMDMWMKNTSIPLDMMFINAEGVIFKIEENAEPGSLKRISSGSPGRYVLEVLAGSVKRFGISMGDYLVLPGVFSGNEGN